MEEKLREKDKGEEARYKLAEEQAFKIRARRNKLIGLRIAAEGRLAEAAAGVYAAGVVRASLDFRNDDEFVAYLSEECAGLSVAMDADALRVALDEAAKEAFRQIVGEHPHALDDDHERVGG